jgi:predicted transposase YdaD
MKGVTIGEERQRLRAHQEKLESARKMKQDGLPAVAIAKYTGLSLEELGDAE